MKKLRKGMMVLIVISFLSSCMSVRYIYDSPDESIMAESSYRLEEHCLDYNMDVTMINQQRIENAIHQQLQQMNMRRDDEATQVIKYFVKNEVRYFSEGCDDYYDQINGGPMCVERISSYEEGTLVIDVIDEAKDQVLWHGAAMGPTYDDRLSNPDKHIKKIVGELLSDFQKKINS